MLFDRFSRILFPSWMNGWINGGQARHVYDYKGMKLSFVHSNYFIRLFIAGDKMYIPVILV